MKQACTTPVILNELNLVAFNVLITYTDDGKNQVVFLILDGSVKWQATCKT